MKACFELTQALTFATVPELYTQLQGVLKETTAACFCVNASQVTQCDSAGLALLIEMRRLCAHRQMRFELQDMPTQVVALARSNGVYQEVLNG